MSVLPEQLKTVGRTLFNGKATGTGDLKGVKPVGSTGVAFLCIVTMANAANLVLRIKSADDADGLNPVALVDNVSIFKEDIRQADAKAFTVDDDSGVFTVVFNVPSIFIPTGKFICLEFESSNAANVLSAVAIDDAYHESGQAPGLAPAVDPVVYQNLVASAYAPLTLGNDGDPITIPMLESDNKIILEDPWLKIIWEETSDVNGGVTISTGMDTALPVPVQVDATEHVFNSGKSLAWKNKYGGHFVRAKVQNQWESGIWFDKVTTFGYIELKHDGDANQQHDILLNHAFPEYSAVQVRGLLSTGLWLTIHTENGDDGDPLNFTLNKRYFWNNHYDKDGDAIFALFDPLASFSEVGRTTSTPIGSGQVSLMDFCRQDTHGRELGLEPTENNRSRISQVGFDFTGKFPILPVVI